MKRNRMSSTKCWKFICIISVWSMAKNLVKSGIVFKMVINTWPTHSHVHPLCQNRARAIFMPLSWNVYWHTANIFCANYIRPRFIYNPYIDQNRKYMSIFHQILLPYDEINNEQNFIIFKFLLLYNIIKNYWF